MVKLYYLSGACSFVPHVALHWANAEFEAIQASLESIKSVEYLAKNPLGKVPFLEDGNFNLSENLAILHYIQSKYPQATLFGSQKDQQVIAKSYQWLAFCNSDLHPKFVGVFVPSRFADSESAQTEVKSKSIQQIIDTFAIADRRLQEVDYLAGEKSVADIYLYTIIRWAKMVSIDLSKFSALDTFYNRIDVDESVRKAKAEESIN